MPFDLELTEEERFARDWAADFARKEMREATIDGVPVHRHFDEVEEFPWPVVEKAAQIGLYGLDYYSMVGEDQTGLTSALVLEEIFHGCAGIGLSIFGSGLALAGLAGTVAARRPRARPPRAGLAHRHPRRRRSSPSPTRPASSRSAPRTPQAGAERHLRPRRSAARGQDELTRPLSPYPVESPPPA